MKKNSYGRYISIRYDSPLRFLRWPGFYLIRALTYAAMWACTKLGRVMYITGTGEDKDVYLIRYYVFKSQRLGNIFIHQFLRPDRDDVHDHPWNFCTYLVDGAYVEYKWNEAKGMLEKTQRYNDIHCRNWGDPHLQRITWSPFIFRKATDQHKVVTANTYKPDQRRFAPLTICVTGPTIREWGFIKEEYVKLDQGKPGQKNVKITLPSGTKDANIYRGPVRRWVPWREYLGLPPDTPGRG